MLACLAAALALLTLAGCSGEPLPNILLITVDTLRADRLGVYGNHEWNVSPSPHVDALAERAVVFELHTVPRGQTRPALASLLTGKYPSTHGLRENGLTLLESHRTLFEHLKQAGYRVGIFLANLHRAYPGSRWAYRGADVAQDGFLGRDRSKVRQEARFQAVWDARVEQAALDFLQASAGRGPFALWVHFYDVHQPYNPPRGFDRYGHGDGSPEALRASSPDAASALHDYIDRITLGDLAVSEAELRRIRGLYDGAVAATDARVGRILERLTELGETPDTIVVFTADHGEELFDHNRYFYHGNSVYPGVLRVPFLVAGPGIAAGWRFSGQMQNVDVAPTLLELVGLPPPDDMEGVSLAPILRGASHESPRHFSYFEWQDVIYSISDGRHYYVHNPRHAHPRKAPFDAAAAGGGYSIDCFELYDLERDPLSTWNLLDGVDPAALAGPEGPLPALRQLREALAAWRADPRHAGAMAPLDAIDAEEHEFLRQLGYVTGTGTHGRDAVFLEPCAP